MSAVSAHGRKGAFVDVIIAVLLSGVGDCGFSCLIVVTWIGVGLAMLTGGATGLKLDGAAPNTGTVAVDANEITGAGKARLKRGSGPSPEKPAGGER